VQQFSHADAALQPPRAARVAPHQPRKVGLGDRQRRVQVRGERAAREVESGRAEQAAELGVGGAERRLRARTVARAHSGARTILGRWVHRGKRGGRGRALVGAGARIIRSGSG
jgi:hypothetical protein